MWVKVEELKEFTGVKPEHLKLKKQDDTELDKILVKWITQSESLIKSYTHNDLKKEKEKEAVKNICLRLAANMIALAIERRDTPRTIVSDWSIKVSSSKIFTEDLKEDLAPFVIEKSNKSDVVSFYAITGD